MPTHPINISSGSSFAGSPYQGPDEFVEWWGQWKFEYIHSYHNTHHNLHLRSRTFRG
ncbi:hypothetical protein Hanom_Chr11g01012301 [Helianthus anomalus]